MLKLGNELAGKGYDHVSTLLEYPKAGLALPLAIVATKM